MKTMRNLLLALLVTIIYWMFFDTVYQGVTESLTRSFTTLIYKLSYPHY